MILVHVCDCVLSINLSVWRVFVCILLVNLLPVSLYVFKTLSLLRFLIIKFKNNAEQTEERKNERGILLYFIAKYNRICTRVFVGKITLQLLRLMHNFSLTDMNTSNRIQKQNLYLFLLCSCP